MSAENTLRQLLREARPYVSGIVETLKPIAPGAIVETTALLSRIDQALDRPERRELDEQVPIVGEVRHTGGDRTEEPLAFRDALDAGARAE